MKQIIPSILSRHQNNYILIVIILSMLMCNNMDAQEIRLPDFDMSAGKSLIHSI